MPEKIGKYEVVERIGRGGMGMIFKARDPVLDRLVALKVISRDIDITDELRARFFREAQACARLSHPNIVTVYDMGEDDSRLFIVMELLDGEELRRLISERRPSALEDKLAIMVQVCEGLHYAHEKGIVHRDIKPGNIMVSPTGQAKILDFGIAHIANTAADLTRTGLIMGTLRYISPEQVRGRADRRSDVFSVGAVFYEFLGSRPPFTGDDPMQLLEQLRTEDPPSLAEIDAGIPPDLAAVVARAMRKDPAERYPDLEQMGGEIEEIRRGLTERAHGVRARVREQRGQLVALQSTLAELVGCGRDDEGIPTLDERGRLATMLALERDLARRIDDVQAKIARADVLAPALQHGLDLFAAGEFSDAVMEFEAIVADMPEHARAVEALGQAQARVSAERRRQLTAELVENARAALADGAYALCLEILKQAAEIPPPDEAAMDVAALRETAQAALTAQEAVQRMRQQAERARDRMAQARGAALVYVATPYAAALWEEAEAKANGGQAALARDAYAEAQEAFSEAEAAYRVFESTAREAQARDREAVARAREEMSQGRERAREAGAQRYARELWDRGEAKGDEAQHAAGAGAFARALSDVIEAGALYRQAEGVANTARESQRRRAEEARDHAALARQQAVDAGVPQHAPELWTEASSKASEAEALLARHEYAQATEAFVVVSALHRRAEGLARDVRQRLQQQSEQARQIMSDSRRSAEGIDARRYAPVAWDEAESSAASGEAAFAREVYPDATPSFERATAAYRHAEGLAREALRALEAARTHAEKARDASALARRGAAETRAAQHASKQWLAAESAEAEASGALERQDYAAARTLFIEARRLYGSAAQAAGVAQEAEARRVDAMVADSRRLFASGEFEACLRRLGDVLKLRPEHPAANELRLEAEGRAREVETAPAEAETIYEVRGADDLERTRLLDEPATALSPERTETLATAAPSSADATVLSEGTVRGQMPATVAGPPKMAGPAVADGASKTADVASLETILPSSPSPSSDAMAAPSERRPRGTPAGENRRHLVVGKRSIVVALSAVAVIVLAVIYLPQLGVRPSPLPSPSLEGLSKQAAEARQDAIKVGAEPFAQFAVATGKQKDADGARALKDIKAAERWYQEAVASYRQAKIDAESERATARAAQNRATEARKAAESAGAPSRAASLWAKAETAQREAEAALDQHTFDRAQTLFGGAERGYREAEQQARDYGRGDADGARKLAASARREGERADARRLAPASFASAQQEEDGAVMSLDRRDWLAAATGFQKSVRMYKQAVQDAGANRRALQRTDAMQAQERGTAARHDAEQAAAGQRAAILFAWAERKQREAQGAFGRSEFDEAARLFRETQADYEAAAQEAKRGDGGASGRPSAEQAQRRTALYRERAIKVGAERLAQDRFIMARAKEAGADELMRQLSFPLAAQSYGEAGDRYLDAARRAGERLEANTARTRMQAEKQRANQNAPEYGAALTEEEYGTSAYERLAYKEATDRFTTALAFYAKAAAKRVAGAPSSPPPAADSQPGALVPRKH